MGFFPSTENFVHACVLQAWGCQSHPTHSAMLTYSRFDDRVQGTRPPWPPRVQAVLWVAPPSPPPHVECEGGRRGHNIGAAHRPPAGRSLPCPGAKVEAAVQGVDSAGSILTALPTARSGKRVGSLACSIACSQANGRARVSLLDSLLSAIGDRPMLGARLGARRGTASRKRRKPYFSLPGRRRYSP